MEFSEESSKNIQELQFIEQQLQAFLAQKQSIQIELNEVLNAIEELSKTEEEVYKIVSGIMIKSNKEILEKELQEKKKLSELRISSIERQEKLIEEKKARLQKEFMHTAHQKKK